MSKTLHAVATETSFYDNISQWPHTMDR